MRFPAAALVMAVTTFAWAEPLLLTGGHIYTADNRRPQVEAVVVVDGKILFAGAAAEAGRMAPADARRIDLRGRTVLPGLTDSHVHLAGIGFRELEFNLEGAPSLAALQERVRERAAQTARGTWVVGRGWIESKWSPPVFPTAADLDAVAPNHPVCLRRADGHAIVVNSLALKLAGIDRSTPNPSGGEILRDARTGEATGMLVDRAMVLVGRLVPDHSAEEVARALEVGAARELSLGWTQVQVAGNGLEEAAALRRLVVAGKIKLRIYDAVSGPGRAADELLKTGPQREGDGSRFTMRGIKLYVDGALGSRGAALLAPYADAPASTGLIVNTEDKLMPVLVAALRRGVQIETHAIGDRGNRFILDLYEQAFAAVPAAERAVREPRWRVEHAQVIAPADIPRFAKLGVIASMQPSHAIGDLYFAPSRLGPERLKGAYAWRTLLDSGAVICGGSDAPVERGEPLIEFYAAVARKAIDGFSNADWHREQRVTRAEALRMFTMAPAFASFQENERGSIAVGKVADFSVFSADIMTIPEEEILKARCVMTIVGGEVVYEAK
ncbi:MAG: amidohydrolase [Verrucomicrobia bacterium]|nr:amidohydrolase [Verrucomicrobiota bacterium]